MTRQRLARSRLPLPQLIERQAARVTKAGARMAMLRSKFDEERRVLAELERARDELRAAAGLPPIHKAAL